MIKRITSVFFLTFASMTANASLIGDTVHVGHYEPTTAAIHEHQGTDITIGQADIFAPALPNVGTIYEVSFTGNSVLVDYQTNLYWGDDRAFNGLMVSDIDSVLTNFEIDTNFVGWDDSNLVFADGALSFNWVGLSYTSDTFFNVEFDVQPASVPEPASLALLGLGLAGIGISRRRKAA